jgi:hypothetical protein
LSDAGLESAGVQELTGYAAAALPESEGDWTFRTCSGALEFGTGVFRADYEKRMKYYPPAAAFAGMPRLRLQPEVGDEVLAEWAEGSAVSLARSTRLGFPSVFNAGPLLPESILHKLAGQAGVHGYAAPKNLVYANDVFMAVHTASAGPCEIRLRRAARVYDLWSEQWLTDGPVTQLTFDGPAQQTLLWRLYE